MAWHRFLIQNEIAMGEKESGDKSPHSKTGTGVQPGHAREAGV
jgi:hypothetical protein